MDAAAIQALLESELDPDGAGRACRVRPIVGARPYSRLFYAECEHFRYPLLVKRCLRLGSEAGDAAAARTQFLGLKRAWKKAGGVARYGVPEPVLLREQDGIVVAEWVAAPSMTQRLCAWGILGSPLERLMDDAAHWLRWFHAGQSLPKVMLDCDELASRLGEGDAAVLSDARFKPALLLLQRRAAEVGKIRTPCSELHGDFKADNLLVSAERVVAIDLQPDHRHSVLFDLASFLNHLDLLAWHPRAWRVAVLRRRLGRRFTDCYFGGRVPRDQELALRWLRIFNLLGAWLDAASESQSWLRYRFGYFCYRRVVQALTRELASTTR